MVDWDKLLGSGDSFSAFSAGAGALDRGSADRRNRAYYDLFTKCQDL